jgi:rhamnulokinase
MSSKKIDLLAFDLGAESGRAMLGHFQDGLLKLEEVHRFPNGPVRIGSSLHWDILRLWSELQQGLKLASQRSGCILRGVGVDTWGVDFALLAADDTLIGNPYHYRDSRTDGMLAWAFQRLPRQEIYRTTGVQFMQLNSLYQLLALVKAGSPALDIARSFLTIPDLLNFWLTGRKVNEFTNATTTQCFDPLHGGWAMEMLEKLGLPTHLFGEIVPPGTVLGNLRSSIIEDCYCPPLPVIAPATHDTGSAVAAVPARGTDHIYISSGTWSLMGVEIIHPLITPESLASNFTNEGGVNGTIRFLKNIMGLWLVQECRREWSHLGSTYSYDDLSALAAAAPPFTALIDPDDDRFLPPGDMVKRIQGYCRETGQPVPDSPPPVIRCILESLALEYRWVAERLEKLLQKPLPVVHIIGGGSQNRLLNQFTADALNREVIAGPVEATAIGNLLVQALGLGILPSLSEARQVVRDSFNVTHFLPADRSTWDEAYGVYLKLKEPHKNW